MRSHSGHHKQLSERVFHKTDDVLSDQGRSARTLRACTQNIPRKPGNLEHNARFPVSPVSCPATSPRWQRPWSSADCSPRSQVRNRLMA